MTGTSDTARVQTWRRAGAKRAGRVLAVALAVATTTTTTATVTFAQPVATEDRAAARALGKEGVALYKQGDYEGALDKLTRAHQIVHLTTTGLWRARCLVGLRRLVEASEQYLEVSRMTVGDDALDVHRNAIDEARSERDALMPLIAKVRLVADALPPGAIVTIDGKAIPAALIGAERPLDPGEHLLVVTHGDQRREQRFSLAEGEQRSLQLDATAAPPSQPPQPPPTTPPSDPPPPPADDSSESSLLVPIGWAAIGIGGAGLAAGLITGVMALGKKSDLESDCVEGNCLPAFHDDVDAFETLRTVSTITLIAGGVLAVAGVTMVIVAPSPEEPASASLSISPTGGALSVRF